MKGHFYFIGIAGHAIRGLALAARELGYEVTGLDEAAVPPGSDWLDEQGISWARAFEPAQLDGVTAVIVTGAHVSDDYPAIAEARGRKIPIKSFAQLFGELTASAHVVAVAGTHGKTTTTSLIAWLMESASHHPDYLIGIRPFNFDTSVRLQGSSLVIVEGDEYKASSLENKSKVQYYHPDTLVITSIEHDHPDFYPDLSSVVQRFNEIINELPPDGKLIVCADSATVREVAEAAPCPVISYGLDGGDYVARNIAYLPGGIEFDIEDKKGILGRIAVPLYGKHSVLNSLAATAVALSEGLTVEQVTSGASTFKGAYRRFNLLTPADADVVVIDDYAHHPTEVSATLEATKLHFKDRRVVAVFRPHTYSRTRTLLKEYQQAFDAAGLTYITDIEGARESGQEQSVSGLDIVQGLNTPALYVPTRSGLIAHFKSDLQHGDVVVCMTVSGHEKLAEELAQISQHKQR